MIIKNYWMKLSRIKLILTGIILVLLGPMISQSYSSIIAYLMIRDIQFHVPTAPFADWWVHYYIIWPFYIPGIVILIIGIILVIKRRNDS